MACDKKRTVKFCDNSLQFNWIRLWWLQRQYDDNNDDHNRYQYGTTNSQSVASSIRASHFA